MTRFIGYTCLQKWKLAASLALFSMLPSLSSFSFSQNLLTNPGFENGTNGWTLLENTAVQYMQSGGRSPFLT